MRYHYTARCFLLHVNHNKSVSCTSSAAFSVANKNIADDHHRFVDNVKLSQGEKDRAEVKMTSAFS